jgi:glycosyltransferase involved in cell wall biosynthesis
MRIAIIHENWGAGAARCAQDLKRELAARHSVLYFPRSNHETAETILDELSRFRPDVVNCHSFYGNLPYEFLATISNLYRTCFTVHDVRPVGTMQWECWDCAKNATCRSCPFIQSRWRQLLRNDYYHQRKIKRKTHAKCSADMQVVCPSQWMLRRLAAQELNRFNLHYIPNGIDLDHFKPVPNARNKLGFPADRPIILFSCWFESNRAPFYRKGLPDLATAFVSNVLPSIPGAMLAVAGESFVPNHPSVRPLGLVSQDHLPGLLSAVDVYVTPTLADNLPYAVLEAMGCAIPVVATNVGGLPEQVVHLETGLLVAPSQPAALGAALVEIISDPNRARRMGTSGRKRIEENYSMTAFIGAYERLFQAMTERV